MSSGAPSGLSIQKMIGKAKSFKDFIFESTLSIFLNHPFRFIVSVSISSLFLRYLVFLINYKRLQARKKLPWLPGPTPLPALGSLDLILKATTDSKRNPLVHHALMNEAKKYNGIFGLWMGSAYTIVITKPSVAEEAFCTHTLENGEVCRGNVFTDRAANQSHGGNHVPSMYIMTRNGKGIAMSTGAYWRKVRGRLVAHITNKRSAEANVGIVQEEACSIISEWRFKTLRGEKIDNLNSQLKRESMNVAMRILFNKRYGANLPDDFRKLVYCVEWFFCNLASGNPSDMIPQLRLLPNAFVRKAKETAAIRDNVLGRLISTHRAEWESLRRDGKMDSRNQARGLVDQFFFDTVEGFQVTNENGIAETMFMNDDEIHVCVWDILFAMTDTTASTNEWMVYNLVNHPHVQAKVHEELDRVVGADRLPTLDDRDNLPYLWAVLKEVMRFRIISPIMAPHYAKSSTTLHDTNGKEFFIPQGTTAYMHGYAMGSDSTLWNEPEKFIPERWFSKRNENLDFYGQVKRSTVEHYKFIPFSLGPRMCPGYALAKVSLFMQAATILHCTKFSLSDDCRSIGKEFIGPDGKLDMTEDWGLTIMPRHYGELGMIKATIRQPSFLCHPLPSDIDYDNKFLSGIFKKTSLIAREPVGKNSIRLRFGFPDKRSILGLPAGKYMKVSVPLNNGSMIDDSTGEGLIDYNCVPVTQKEDLGFVDIILKDTIEDSASEKLAQLVVGDRAYIKGPCGPVEYIGKSFFKLGDTLPVEKRMVGIITSDVGIAPIFQIITTGLFDADDKTMFSVVYVDDPDEGILMHDMLDSLARRFPGRLKLQYNMERHATQGDSALPQVVPGDKLIQRMPPASDDALIIFCGISTAEKSIYVRLLAEIGYENGSIIELDYESESFEGGGLD